MLTRTRIISGSRISTVILFFLDRSRHIIFFFFYLPVVSTIYACHKSCHRFIRTASLHLEIGTFSALAFTALEHIGLRLRRSCTPGLVQGLLGKLPVSCFGLFRCHFLYTTLPVKKFRIQLIEPYNIFFFYLHAHSA